LAAARKAKALILVSKLDRLGRNVEFIAGLVRKVPFVVSFGLLGWSDSDLMVFSAELAISPTGES
jgi:hypothetical protein